MLKLIKLINKLIEIYCSKNILDQGEYIQLLVLKIFSQEMFTYIYND